jgi:hypothetical protein
LTCESRFGTLLMGADAVSCGRGDDRRQPLFQWAMVATLHTAAAAAGLCGERWIWERAGDGGVILLPPDQPGPQLVEDFVRALGRTLAWLNSELAHDARLRLRVAIHYVTVIPAQSRWAAQGVDAVSRLLDSRPIRLALAAADEANLAVILSRQAFDQVVRPGGVSLREPDFRRVTVAEKEYSAQAWLRVPGLGPDELAVGDAMDHTVSLAAATAGDAAGGYLRSS